MINKFLKAKHWQLFSLIIGIPLVFQLMIMMAMFSSILSGGHPDSTILFSYMRLFPLMMILFIGVLFGWFWSIAVGLQYKVPEGVKMNVGRFKIFFFSPLIYIFLFLFFLWPEALLTAVSSLRSRRHPRPGPRLLGPDVIYNTASISEVIYGD